MRTNHSGAWMSNHSRQLAPHTFVLSRSVSARSSITITMVTFYDEIVPELHDFIIKQPVFFTGSAPLHLPNSHVNVSPKGYTDSTFTISNPRCVWYQDATGSGMAYINSISDA